LQKGVYPYEWVDSPERFNETQLPPKEAFYSQLNGAGISDEAYEHAQKVWEAFNCKTIRDYHNLYNMADVLQLADIFESFRDVCMANYKLDPVLYYTAPGLAWVACLKLTGITLELPQTYEILLLIKFGSRGGILSTMNRYAEANNKYMSDYDAKAPSTFIKHLDANNLYGWAYRYRLETSNGWMSTNSECGEVCLAYWKLTWNIPRSCTTCTMTTLSHLRV
jgi:hypothetical protein